MINLNFILPMNGNLFLLEEAESIRRMSSDWPKLAERTRVPA